MVSFWPDFSGFASITTSELAAVVHDHVPERRDIVGSGVVTASKIASNIENRVSAEIHFCHAERRRMTRTITAFGLAALCAVSLAACGKSSNVSSESANAGSAMSNAASGGTVLVKQGATFDGKLDKEISSNASKDGDTFTLTETDTMFKKNAALHGAMIEGHLAGVTAAGVGKKPGMTIVFDDIKMPDGTTAPINVQLMNVGAFDAKTHHWRTAGMMIAGAMAGHVAARAAGKSHGGLMGAAGGYLLSQQIKSDIDVKPGTMIEVKFLSDATSAAGSAAPAASPT